MQRFSTSPELRGLPGVPVAVQDYMQGEDRGRGRVIEVKSWHRWSDARKLRWMRQLVKRYGQDPAMNTFVAQNVFSGAGISPRDYPRQAAAILRWVQTNIYYVNEPGEIIRTPWRTMREKTGDCDDMAILMAAFAEAVAMPWRFVLAGKYGGKPHRVAEGKRMPWGFKAHHIYVEVGFPPFSKNPTWVSMEPTIQNAPLGYDVVKNGHSVDRNGAVQLPEMAGWGMATIYGNPDPGPGTAIAPVPQMSFTQWVKANIEPRQILLEGFKSVLIAGVASVITLMGQRLLRANRRRNR